MFVSSYSTKTINPCLLFHVRPQLFLIAPRLRTRRRSSATVPTSTWPASIRPPSTPSRSTPWRPKRWDPVASRCNVRMSVFSSRLGSSVPVGCFLWVAHQSHRWVGAMAANCCRNTDSLESTQQLWEWSGGARLLEQMWSGTPVFMHIVSLRIKRPKGKWQISKCCKKAITLNCRENIGVEGSSLCVCVCVCVCVFFCVHVNHEWWAGPGENDSVRVASLIIPRLG